MTDKILEALEGVVDLNVANAGLGLRRKAEEAITLRKAELAAREPTEDVMEVARACVETATVEDEQYGDPQVETSPLIDSIAAALTKAAADATKAEREACAKIVEPDRDPTNPFAPLPTSEHWLRGSITAAIRARSEQGGDNGAA